MKDNKFTVKLLEVLQGPEKKTKEGPTVRPIFLVMDSMPGNFSDFLYSEEAPDLSEQAVRKILYSLLCGLKFLHSANLMHRDVKPANILIDEELNVVFCDFGFARTRVDHSEESINRHEPTNESTLGRRRLSRHVTTRYYRAPEVILMEKHYDAAVDIWGLGCILAELLAASRVYRAENSSTSWILFKGDSCYPLSPKASRATKVGAGD
mmetsp:Transcript_12979/g.20117  ORF Transcript_12979/g.20117 Transcript_12979/m.20117 type:complete len:209 (-) Transcript_12979:337-963(-)|eukprot:CAMPEP_0170505134 /NCGR_PEP_ID=MMETSP0208-20121228/49948_1 /TAXON_ID=197538 /ORGANISM="Strombidium inclinatum, Strain S3" /LENGTH=208 /DNA_ID=CAMNT_0010785793 /DNA_START=190 /DNA_END=816 /DNA_ORIENTATION=-